MSATALEKAYKDAKLTELEIPPEALIVSVEDGVDSDASNNPNAITWLQPVVTSFDTTDGLVIKLNGPVQGSQLTDIKIEAQTFEAGSTYAPMGVEVTATLTPVEGEPGTYKISPTDLTQALKDAGASGANALTVKVGDPYAVDAPSSVAWLEEVLVAYKPAQSDGQTPFATYDDTSGAEKIAIDVSGSDYSFADADAAKAVIKVSIMVPYGTDDHSHTEDYDAEASAMYSSTMSDMG